MSEAPAPNPEADLGCRVLIVLALPGFALFVLLLGNIFRPSTSEMPDVATLAPPLTEAVVINDTATATHTLNAVEIAYTEISAGNQTREAQQTQQSGSNPLAIAQVASSTSAANDALNPTVTPSFTAIVPTVTPSNTASAPTATPSFTSVIEPPTLTPIPPTQTQTSLPANTTLPVVTAMPVEPTPTPSFTAIVRVDASTQTPIVPTAMAQDISDTLQPTSAMALSGANQEASAVTYTVQSGDTLFQIATRYNTSVEAINTANNLTAADYIYPGQELIMPGVTSDFTPVPTAIPDALENESEETIPLTLMPTTEILGVLPTIAVTVPPLPPDVVVNGIEDDQFVLIPDNVVRNIRRIYETGQAMGRNPQAFTRIGDSTIEMPHFFTRFDGADYHLGEYDYLQGVIDYYAGSFNHDSAAVKRGLHTWSVFDPQWADGCGPQEHMLACEFRQHNPSIILIRLGSNDRGVPDSTDRNLRQVVEYCIENGVIPVLGTKADRFDGPSDVNNTLIRRIAAEYELPLWDFDRVASTVPGRGLGADNVHMTFFYAHDWRQAGGFQTGHGVHNLTGLIMLDAVWRVLSGDES